MQTLLDILTRTESFFTKRGLDKPKLEAQVLLAELLGVDRLQLFLQFDRPLTDEELDKLREPVRRRGEGEPLAYILGKREFWSLDFAVGEGVLIPRPDTETLVEAALALIKDERPAPRRDDVEVELILDEPVAQVDPDAPVELVLDELQRGPLDDLMPDDGAQALGDAALGDAALGDAALGDAALTSQAPAVEAPPDAEPLLSDGGDGELVYLADVCAGTGCVGISLAHERAELRVYATELSEQALGYLKQNISAHGMQKRVAALQGDLLAPIPPRRPIDVIVSNPPYIATSVLAGLAVREHEPELALDGGADGLDIYRRLVPEAARRARRGVAVEIGYDQGEAVAKIFRDAGLHDVVVKKDLGRRDRVVMGWTRAR